MANSKISALTDASTPFAEQVKGNYFHPGDDYSQEDAKVQSVCALIHTPEVIAAYKEAQNANINPTA